MKTTAFFIFLLLFPVFSAAFSIEITNSLGPYADYFVAGTKYGALDNYEISTDLLQPPGMGTYVQIATKVQNNLLKGDFRSELMPGENKTWQIILIASQPEYIGLDGLNILTWNISASEDYGFELLDYGNDKSRKNIVAQIDLNKEKNYSYTITSALGQYRFLDLIVNRSAGKCDENWLCTDWLPQECPASKVQTRVCTDQNNCGTVINKSAETRNCTYTCTPEWNCSTWSACINENKVRECNDLNNCGTVVSKPPEAEACSEPSPQPAGGGAGGGGGSASFPITPKLNTTKNNTQKPEINESISKEEKQESSPKKNQTTFVDTLLQNPLVKITGAQVVSAIKSQNPVVGISIIAVILVSGLAIYIYRRK